MEQYRPCPGCTTLIEGRMLACRQCWKRVPAMLKARFSVTEPSSAPRRRLIYEIRKWVADNPRPVAGAGSSR